MFQRLYVAVVLVLFGGLGAYAAEPRKEIHFPDLPGYRTLKCDFHIHTVFSDGLVWPTVRIDEAWRQGLDAIALTDHIEYQPHRKDVPTQHQRPYEVAIKRAKEHGILLIRGAEITRSTPPGHFNALFLSNIDPLDTEDFYTVFAEAQKQNAFVFWNHPGWKGVEKGRWGEEQTRLLEAGQLHGIEICNGEDYFAEAHQTAMEKNLTLFGDSDIHDPLPDAGPNPSDHRTLTLVFTKERTLEAIHDALVAGRTAVWAGNRLFARQEWLEAIFVASVDVEPPHHRTDKDLRLRMHNRSHCAVEMQRIGPGSPDRITLPARATTLVRFKLTPEQTLEEFPCRVLNYLQAPDQPLTTRLKIPTN
ncbi:MAG: PHP domain-containing protein [bacterium]|nr:PHP domain-containing protein [bacterium]